MVTVFLNILNKEIVQVRMYICPNAIKHIVQPPISYSRRYIPMLLQCIYSDIRSTLATKNHVGFLRGLVVHCYALHINDPVKLLIKNI